MALQLHVGGGKEVEDLPALTQQCECPMLQVGLLTFPGLILADTSLPLVSCAQEDLEHLPGQESQL